jgi:hypothetical protein
MANYFLNRPVSLICADLISHRTNPEELFFVKALDGMGVPQSGIALYKQYLVGVIGKDNYYWTARRAAAANGGNPVNPGSGGR